MKEKVYDLVRLHDAIQEKLKTASYSEQIQIQCFSRWVPEKKECVSVSKGVHKQNPCSLQKSL